MWGILRVCYTPRKGRFGRYHESGTCLGGLETHVVLSYLWSVSCKRTVINVTLETLKKSYMKYNTNMFCQKTFINDNNLVYICLSSE